LVIENPREEYVLDLCLVGVGMLVANAAERGQPGQLPQAGPISTFSGTGMRRGRSMSGHSTALGSQTGTFRRSVGNRDCTTIIL
jgi:hypothetical protein